MSIRTRLLLYLLVCTPLVWAAAVLIAADRARHEVNELFDTELIRLARQVQSTMPAAPALQPTQLTQLTMAKATGEADLEDLAIAVWDRFGTPIMLDREGAQLPFMPRVAGFVDTTVRDEAWRIFYLHSPDGERLVAAGQRLYERDELVFNLVASQLLPWLLVLPALIIAIIWSVRQAMRPVDALSQQLEARRADDLRPLAVASVPRELSPLVAAMNELLGRFDKVLTRERQFTADAAHELRTPLAALSAQWDLVRLAKTEAQREQAGVQVAAGLTRMSRLVTQMLELTRLEVAGDLPRRQAIVWQDLIQQVMGDCMPVADRRRIQMSCQWSTTPDDAWLLEGDPDMIAVMLRNLLDNAVRYATPDTEVIVRVGVHDIRIENAGPAQAASIRETLGQRFRRGESSGESGSGLGLSIVQRIARLHGLAVWVDDRLGGGVIVGLQFASTESAAATRLNRRLRG
ncbi:MAG: hypothetical protein RI906_3839 [Pseudomonadota bacterium]|jgi:two-component system sensor histidine kinase QseC